MPDLSPDLSPYKNIAAEGQANQLSLPQLLSLTQASRALTTQSAISDAMRANPNDPQAALRAAIANPESFMGPEDVTRATNAASAQFDLRKKYFQEAANAVTTLLGKVDKDGNLIANLDDWHWIAPKLSWMMGGGPEAQGLLHSMETTADPRTGRLDQNRLAQLYSVLSGGKAYPTKEIPGQMPGTTREVPATAPLYSQTPTPQPRPTSAGGGSTQAPQPTIAPISVTEQAKKDVDFSKVAADQAKASVPPQGMTGGVAGVTGPDAGTLDRYGKSISLYNADLARSTQYQNETVPLSKMISIMRKAGPDITGWGKDVWQGIKSAMISLHLPVSQNDTENYQELRKYMAQQITAAGGQTDYRLFSASHANPNTDLLQQANLNLAQVLLGLRRKDQFAVNEFQRSGLAQSPQLYGEWRSHWDPNIDTTGFVWDKMSPEEQTAYAESHSGTPEEVQRLRYSIKASKRPQSGQ